MDARELLRRYLEQRRELGETELVLDGLSVDDAMAMIAGGGRREAEGGGDELRGTRDESDRSRSRVEAGPSAPTGAPEPPRGRDVPESSDWREALRAAGAVPGPASAEKRPAPPQAPAVRTPDAALEGNRAADEPPVSPESEARSEDPTREDASRLPRPASRENASRLPPPASRENPSREADAPPVVPLPPSLAALAPPGLVVGPTGHDLFEAPGAEFATLDEIARAVGGCTRCPLYATALNPVPGEGNPNADFMCVGEAPGATEDETGRPFVGQAGQLLTKILGAIGLTREDVFICNVLKHRPPGNRNPMPDEVKACSPYLIRQIELVRPKVILALGTFAAQTLLDTKLSIGKLRGQIHRYRGVPLVVTYHPAALLRNPAWKRPTWEDVQLARRILDSADPGA